MALRRFQETQQTDRIRPRQVGSVLLRVIQERIMKGFADPRIRGLVSVTRVDLADDLRTATIGISVLPDKYGVRVLAGLRSADGIFRKIIRDETALRRVPKLVFRLDSSMKDEAALDAAIRDGMDSVGGEDATETDPADPDRRDGPVDADASNTDREGDFRPTADHEVRP